MKIECPNCWQHFEVEPGDLKSEFSCPACDHVFTGKEALKLAPRSRTPWIVTVAVLALILLFSIAGNLWQWHRLDLLRQPPSIRSDSGQVNLAAALIENYRRELDARLTKVEQEADVQAKTAVVQAKALHDLQEAAATAKTFEARLKVLEELHQKYSLSLMNDQLEAQRRRLLKLSQDLTERSGK